MNDTNDTNDNNNNDARETIERYGYERYGYERYDMNDTSDNRKHRHPTPVIYDTSHTITSRRYKHFLPLVQLAAETSVQQSWYLRIVFSCLCANSTTTFVHEDDLTTSINNAMVLLFS